MRRHRASESQVKTPNVCKLEIIAAMEQWIIGRRSERDRAIFYDHLFRGITYEEIAEKFDMSPRQIQNIIRACERKVFPHLPG